MSIKDALEISLIGITVVFIGLILTSLLIGSFSVFKKIGQKIKNREKRETEEENIQIIGKDISPEIVAVISAVIEIEKRLFASLRGTRFTFDNESPRGWSEEGKMIVNPFEGGKIK